MNNNTPTTRYAYSSDKIALSTMEEMPPASLGTLASMGMLLVIGISGLSIHFATPFSWTSSSKWLLNGSILSLSLALVSFIGVTLVQIRKLYISKKHVHCPPPPPLSPKDRKQVIKEEVKKFYETPIDYLEHSTSKNYTTQGNYYPKKIVRAINTLNILGGLFSITGIIGLMATFVAHPNTKTYHALIIAFSVVLAIGLLKSLTSACLSPQILMREYKSEPERRTKNLDYSIIKEFNADILWNLGSSTYQRPS